MVMSCAEHKPRSCRSRLATCGECGSVTLGSRGTENEMAATGAGNRRVPHTNKKRRVPEKEGMKEIAIWPSAN